MASFNPRAHAGRDPKAANDLVDGMFQSTRPRGARHSATALGESLRVSIHAPTRGATINAPLWSAFVGFNPRAHAGRDLS